MCDFTAFGIGLAALTSLPDDLRRLDSYSYLCADAHAHACIRTVFSRSCSHGQRSSSLIVDSVEADEMHQNASMRASAALHLVADQGWHSTVGSHIDTLLSGLPCEVLVLAVVECVL
eukprot:1547976-Pleurochrysis_carterae.AAC.6